MTKLSRRVFLGSAPAAAAAAGIFGTFFSTAAEAAAVRKAMAKEQGADKLRDVLDNLIEDNILGKPLEKSAQALGLEAQQSGLASAQELQQKLGVTASTGRPSPLLNLMTPMKPSVPRFRLVIPDSRPRAPGSQGAPSRSVSRLPPGTRGRSVPSVVSSPWPVLTTVSSDNLNSLALIELTSVS